MRQLLTLLLCIACALTPLHANAAGCVDAQTNPILYEQDVSDEWLSREPRRAFPLRVLEHSYDAELVRILRARSRVTEAERAQRQRDWNLPAGEALRAEIFASEASKHLDRLRLEVVGPKLSHQVLLLDRDDIVVGASGTNRVLPDAYDHKLSTEWGSNITSTMGPFDQTCSGRREFMSYDALVAQVDLDDVTKIVERVARSAFSVIDPSNRVIGSIIWVFSPSAMTCRVSLSRPALEKQVRDNPRLDARSRAFVLEKLLPTSFDRFHVEAAVVSNRFGLPIAEVLGFDKQWQEDVKNKSAGASDFQQKLLDNVSSNRLRDTIKDIRVLEVFVTDSIGSLVGLSSLTSDFYQGDEAKFTDSFNSCEGGIHVGDVEYDESASSLAQQVSVCIASASCGVCLCCMLSCQRVCMTAA
jgi:hypothetical protein